MCVEQTDHITKNTVFSRINELDSQLVRMKDLNDMRRTVHKGLTDIRFLVHLCDTSAGEDRS